MKACKNFLRYVLTGLVIEALPPTPGQDTRAIAIYKFGPRKFRGVPEKSAGCGACS